MTSPQGPPSRAGLAPDGVFRGRGGADASHPAHAAEPAGSGRTGVLATRASAHARRVGDGLRAEAARVLGLAACAPGRHGGWGVAAHGIGRPPSPAFAAVALLLGRLAHTTGWPVPQGGSRAGPSPPSWPRDSNGSAAGGMHTGVGSERARRQPPGGGARARPVEASCRTPRPRRPGGTRATPHR